MAKIGVVYRLVCTDVTVTECYVGSTISTRNRKYEHKNACENPSNKHHNLYVYQFIRSHGGWPNWDMVEIERVTFTEKAELHKRERFHIEAFKAELNSRIPTQTDAEYYIAHQEELKAKQREYYRNNTEKVKEASRTYAKEHKEEIGAKKAEYRELVRERTRTQQNERMLCECGMSHSRGNKTLHYRSKKHLAAMAARPTEQVPITPIDPPQIENLV